MEYAVIFETQTTQWDGGAELCKNIFHAKSDKEALLKVIDKHLFSLSGADLEDYKAMSVDDLVVVLANHDTDDCQDVVYHVQNLTNGKVLYDDILTKKNADNLYTNFTDTEDDDETT